MKPVGILIGALAVVFIIGSLLIAKLWRSGRIDLGKQPQTDIPALEAQAARGDAQAQIQLGRLFAEGRQVPPDYQQAAQYYLAAAQQGSAEGQYRLGELFEAGQGVVGDEIQAADWYGKAASQGHAGAQYALGVMFEFGRGRMKDQTQAARWYRLAANQGEVLAQYNLGQRYELGLGVVADRVEACKWLELAAAQGLKDAVKLRDQIMLNMRPSEIEEAKRRAAAFSPVKEGLVQDVQSESIPFN